MADPVIVACAAGAWTKIATAVTIGQVHVKDTDAAYLHTYRMTGQPAPVAQSEGVAFTGSVPIESVDDIDVYVWAAGAAGSVRVDL